MSIFMVSVFIFSNSYLACVTASEIFSTAFAISFISTCNNSYDNNFWIEFKASPVTCPVTTSERITSRNGAKNMFGLRSSKWWMSELSSDRSPIKGLSNVGWAINMQKPIFKFHVINTVNNISVHYCLLFLLLFVVI